MEDMLLQLGKSTRDAAGDRFRWGDDVREEKETEKLEEELYEISEKLKSYRSTMPGHLKSTLSSILVSQRTIFSLSSNESSEYGPSRRFYKGQGVNSDHSNGMQSADDNDDDERAADDVELLRDKISSNVAAMPIILGRINECICRIDELVSSSRTILPEFKQKKKLI